MIVNIVFLNIVLDDTFKSNLFALPADVGMRVGRRR